MLEFLEELKWAVNMKTVKFPVKSEYPLAIKLITWKIWENQQKHATTFQAKGQNY